MKKTWKRLLALITATLMLVGMLPAAVMAAPDGGQAGNPTNGSVTIIKNGDTEDEFLSGAQFSFYQLASINNANDKWTYTVNKAYEGALGAVSNANLNSLPSGVWDKEDMIDTLTALSVNDKATAISGVSQADTGSTGATSLNLGIYLVKETKTPDGYMASKPFIVAVPSTNNYDKDGAGSGLVYEITARPKNSSQTITKETTVKDVGVGTIVPYTLKTKMPNYGSEYTNVVFNIYDKMSSGLSFDANSLKVYVGGVEVKAAANTFELVTTGFTGKDEDKTFEIRFVKAYIEANTGKDIQVNYSATVNENAVYTNGNTAGIKYNNTPSEESDATSKKVNVYTFGIDLTKTGEGVDANGLDGAVFNLVSDAGGQITASVNGTKVFVVDKDGKKAELATATIATEKGKLVIKGLAAGTYTLTELRSPAGYTLLKNPIKIEINKDADGKFASAKVDGNDVTGISDGIVPVAVANSKGFSLPDTGGMGTYLFTIGGVILMLGAAIILLTMRKKNRV